MTGAGPGAGPGGRRPARGARSGRNIAGSASGRQGWREFPSFSPLPAPFERREGADAPNRGFHGRTVPPRPEHWPRSRLRPRARPAGPGRAPRTRAHARRATRGCLSWRGTSSLGQGHGRDRGWRAGEFRSSRPPGDGGLRVGPARGGRYFVFSPSTTMRDRSQPRTNSARTSDSRRRRLSRVGRSSAFTSTASKKPWMTCSISSSAGRRAS